jgi:outer membrane biosynthesis protein TonB
MARHTNPRYNRKRLIVAGTAAVTMLGAMVGIGIYGSAFAEDVPLAAASQECLPDVTAPTASAPPATTTEETTPSETAPPETAPPEETAPEETAPEDTAPPQESAPEETAPAETPPAESESAPAETMPQEEQTNGYGAVHAASYRPHGRGGQPTQSDEQAVPPAPAVPGEQGPAPAEQPPAAAPDATMQNFGKPSCTDQLGPFPGDFVNIRKVPQSRGDARVSRNGSAGTFVSSCGTNGNKHNNPANFIVAPGNANGAHHLHDYVGNLSADGNSTNESLKAAGTTCRAGDQSTYYWPVVRSRVSGGPDAENPHNVGTVLRPSSATLQFRGNAKSKVVAAPEFIRIVTGDAKAATNGPTNANAKWGCTGFNNRFTTKYPLCPRGSQVSRTLDFPSCWDGVNTDSANHRTHVLFPDKSGACPAGTQAIPQLRMTLTFRVPPGKVYAVDAFPEQLHNPVTDHGDFVNVMPVALMDRAVTCINSGRRC